VVEKVIKTLDGLEGLGAVGGVDDNDTDIQFGIVTEQVGLEVEEEFVLAGLAGEDHGEGVAGVGMDGFEQGLEDGILIGTEGDPGGLAGEGEGVGEEGGEAMGVKWAHRVGPGLFNRTYVLYYMYFCGFVKGV